MRRIHWRATARVGEPVSRRYEPVHERQVAARGRPPDRARAALADALRRREGRGAVRGGRLARASHAAQTTLPAACSLGIAAGRRAALGLPSPVCGGQPARPDRGRPRPRAADPVAALRAAARRRARGGSRRAGPSSVSARATRKRTPTACAGCRGPATRSRHLCFGDRARGASGRAWPRSACRRASPSSSRTGGGPMRSSWPADRIVGWVLPILAILAEGAWLAVVYVAVETTIDGRLPLLGTLRAGGRGRPGRGRRATRTAAARRRPAHLLRAPRRHSARSAGCGTTEARSLVFAGDLAGAIGLHPGGWLLLVAAMRGVGRGVEIDDRALTRLVLVGVPALAIPWILGQLGSGEPAAGLRRARVRRQPDLRLGRIHGRRPGPAPGDRPGDGRRLAHATGRGSAPCSACWPSCSPSACRPPRCSGCRSARSRAASSARSSACSATSCWRVAFVAAILSASALRGAQPDRHRAARTADARRSSRGCRTIREYTIEQLQGPITTVGHPVDRRDPPGGDRASAPGSGAGRAADRAAGPRSGRSAFRRGRSGPGCRGSAGSLDSGRRGAPTDAVGAYLATLDDLGGARPISRARASRVAARPRGRGRTGRPRRAPGRLRPGPIRRPPL